jgi:hypothetical protein
MRSMRSCKGRVDKNNLSLILWYYLLNIFFIIILFLFMFNLTNNLYLVNISLGSYVFFYSYLFAILFLFSFLEHFLDTKFIINNNPVNIKIILLIIFLTFGPFIYLNFFGSFFNNLTYKVLDHFTVHCDSHDNSEYQNKIKESEIKDKIILNRVSYRSFPFVL